MNNHGVHTHPGVGGADRPGNSLHALWAPATSETDKRKRERLLRCGSRRQDFHRGRQQAIDTWLLQCLRAAHQPRQRLCVPVEDLHRQVVILLLLHDSLLQLLLVRRDSAVEHRQTSLQLLPESRVGASAVYLTHDRQLHRQVLHLHKVVFI